MKCLTVSCPLTTFYSLHNMEDNIVYSFRICENCEFFSQILLEKICHFILGRYLSLFVENFSVGNCYR